MEDTRGCELQVWLDPGALPSNTYCLFLPSPRGLPFQNPFLLAVVGEVSSSRSPGKWGTIKNLTRVPTLLLIALTWGQTSSRGTSPGAGETQWPDWPGLEGFLALALREELAPVEPQCGPP